jgi:hypothetical protein
VTLGPGDLGVPPGQGIGTSGPPSVTPTRVVVTNLPSVTAITAGAAHACARLSDRTVACWGDNSFGELGTGMNRGPESCVGGAFACATTPVAVTYSDAPSMPLPASRTFDIDPVKETTLVFV